MSAPELRHFTFISGNKVSAAYKLAGRILQLAIWLTALKMLTAQTGVIGLFIPEAALAFDRVMFITNQFPVLAADSI